MKPQSQRGRFCTIALGTSLIMLMGCATVQMEKVETDKPSYVYPVTGFPLPLGEPSSGEREGVLLRFRPRYDRPLTYNEVAVIFTPDSPTAQHGKRGCQSTMASQRELKFVSPATNASTAYPYVSTVRYGKERGGLTVEQESLIDELGRVTSRTSYPNGLKIEVSRNDPAFPEKRVCIGDTWDQQIETRSTASFVSSVTMQATKWRLSGFAVVRNHRCAVLEGVSSSATDDEKTKVVSRGKSRIVLYFDYQSGVDVEKVIFTSSFSALAVPEHRYGVLPSQEIPEHVFRMEHEGQFVSSLVE